MKLLTWNIQGNRGLSKERLSTVVSLIGANEPDLVTLQEVHKNFADELEARLAELGLEGFHYSRRDDAYCKHGEAIAARLPLRRPRSKWTTKAPYPELMAHAVAEVDDQDVDVVTAHIPNGSGNGWTKIEALEALSNYLERARDQPRIVAGDFNEPHAIHADGTWETFGHTYDRAGNLSSAGEKKGKCGRTFPRSRWCDGVTNVLDGESRHGLRHAYFAQHPLEPNPVTYRTPNPRFFDHVLVSGHFEIERVRYLTDWIDRGWSDHAPGVVQLSLT